MEKPANRVIAGSGQISQSEVAKYMAIIGDISLGTGFFL
jgi:hypothetical protein